MVVMNAVCGYDVDDDPDGARRDDDGDDFPLREGIFLADFCLLESFLPSLWFPPRFVLGHRGVIR